MTHNKLIQQEFSKQAASFGKAGLTLSSQEILNWIVAGLPLKKTMRVLDVAAGTGHLSRAIAPHVKEVVAIDITPEMLAQARRAAEEAGLQNIRIVEGNAEKLPYDDDYFDFVVSRLAIHHFEEPLIQLQEMVRVCKPGHQIGVVDLLAPENTALAKTYNHLERLRDPSHTVALSKSVMQAVLERASIEIYSIEAKDIVVDFERWVAITKVPAEIIAMIRTNLLDDIGKNKTGMRPFMEDDTLKFAQVWAIILGTKK